VTPEQLLCSNCGTEGVPTFVHSLTTKSPHGERTIHELGLPRRDILWARSGVNSLGIEISGGPLPADEGTLPKQCIERQP